MQRGALSRRDALCGGPAEVLSREELGVQVLWKKVPPVARIVARLSI